MSSHAPVPVQENSELSELVRIGIALSNEKDLAALIEMIVTSARKLTHADAGTLYIVDPAARELRFTILQNDTTKVSINAVRDPGAPIPPPVPMFVDGVPNNGNVSSYVGLSGETVSIADVYSAKGFNFTGVKKYDEVSGYHSKSMLVMAMKDHEGQIIGVLQLLNALTPKGERISFAEHDAFLVGALASQAAVALTNTNLLNRMKSDLDEIRRLRDNERELGEKLRDAYVKAETTNEHLQAALDKAWTLRLAGAIFLLLILAIGALSYARGHRELLPDLKSLIAVRTASNVASETQNLPTVGVEVKPVSTAITLLGQIEPIQQVNVTSPFPGKVLQVHFTYGQAVKAGDKLVEIDPGEVMVKLRDAQAALIRVEQNQRLLKTWSNSPEVARAKMNQTRAKAALDSLKRKLDETNLLFSRGVIPKTELESAQEAYDNQEVNDRAAIDEIKSLLERASPENIRIADMEVKNAKVRLDELQAQIDHAVVKAPLSGVVLRPTMSEDDRRAARPIEKGVMVDQGQPLVLIGNLDGIIVRSQVDEVNIGKVSVGQSAQIVGDALPGLVLSGSIEAVSCQAKGVAGRVEGGAPSFDVTVSVSTLDDEAREKVRVGVSASAMVTTYENPEALTIPVSAILSEGEDYFVFRRTAAGGFEKVPIQAGITSLDSVEVIEGLTASDVLALNAEEMRK